VAFKNFYELLELPRTASSEDIKRAFRQQISRYHPDKVDHLGREFQEMAAIRAAELTEAYRVLSDDARRAEYDRGASIPTVVPAEAETASVEAPTSVEHDAPGDRVPPSDADSEYSTMFLPERASRDEFVRKATLARLRQTFAALDGAYDESEARGFDLVWMPKSRRFGSLSGGPRVLVRFVSSVDGRSVAEAWWHAAKWACGEQVTVLLVGPTVAPTGELARSIAEQRLKTRGTNVGLIPMNANTWHAHVPTDTPPLCRTLVMRLQAPV
jgi:DnaJ domain